jgi:hypothetical protein
MKNKQHAPLWQTKNRGNLTAGRPKKKPPEGGFRNKV